MRTYDGTDQSLPLTRLSRIPKQNPRSTRVNPLYDAKGYEEYLKSEVFNQHVKTRMGELQADAKTPVLESRKGEQLT